MYILDIQYTHHAESVAECTTAAWVVHLFTHNRIESYQVSSRAIGFDTRKDRLFASMVITEYTTFNSLKLTTAS